MDVLDYINSSTELATLKVRDQVKGTKLETRGPNPTVGGPRELILQLTFPYKEGLPWRNTLGLPPGLGERRASSIQEPAGKPVCTLEPNPFWWQYQSWHFNFHLSETRRAQMVLHLGEKERSHLGAPLNTITIHRHNFLGAHTALKIFPNQFTTFKVSEILTKSLDFQLIIISMIW